MDDRSFVAAQDFLLATKTFWTTRLYKALKETYGANAAKADTPPETAGDAAALLEGETLYRYFAWLERHLQRFKYAGRYGLVPYHDERRKALLARLEDAGAELSPDLEMPAYYRKVDIHQHPGGVWSDDLAGFVYERGARSTTPLMGASHADLHHRFTELVAARGAPERILDMGCGFGKSTHPFARAFPGARIEAIDLSAPCVTLGAHEAGKNVRFRQENACETGYGDASFDLVTSTMLIHELPPAEIGRMFAESARLLAPGGRIAHLDFHAIEGPFARFLHYGHGQRNNEPFMRPWAEMDVGAVLAEKGFTNIEVIPFAEAEGATSDAWRFPWTVILAEKAGGEESR
ncbi:MAG: class I SAM-dependent methyltransferase [Alphaproteobacteria bacterium]